MNIEEKLMQSNIINPVPIRAHIKTTIGLLLIAGLLSSCALFGNALKDAALKDECECNGRIIDCVELEPTNGFCPSDFQDSGGKIELSCSVGEPSCGDVPPNSCAKASSICECPSGGLLRCTSSSF